MFSMAALLFFYTLPDGCSRALDGPEFVGDDIVALAILAHDLGVHLHGHIEADVLRIRLDPFDVAAHRATAVEINDGSDVGRLDTRRRLIDDGPVVNLAALAELERLELADRHAVGTGAAFAQIDGAAAGTAATGEVRFFVLGQLEIGDDRTLLFGGRRRVFCGHRQPRFLSAGVVARRNARVRLFAVYTRRGARSRRRRLGREGDTETWALPSGSSSVHRPCGAGAVVLYAIAPYASGTGVWTHVHR